MRLDVKMVRHRQYAVMGVSSDCKACYDLSQDRMDFEKRPRNCWNRRHEKKICRQEDVELLKA